MNSEIILILIINVSVVSALFWWYYRRFLFSVIKTLPRDIRGFLRYLQIVWELKELQKGDLSAFQCFENTCRRFPNKVCFYFEDSSWTFAQVKDRSNQIANLFQSKYFKQGDVVCLLMENCPEYFCIWLGLSQLGIITALLNVNLRGEALKHCIAVARPNAIICSQSYILIKEVKFVDFLEIEIPPVELFTWDNSSKSSDPDSFENIAHTSVCCSKEIHVSHSVGFNDVLLYIYTSGTTGLPKPSIIKHSKLFMSAVSFHRMSAMKSSDIIYTSLPMYHTAAGLCAVGQALCYGNSVLLKKKFSAKSFWKDCIKYQITVAQYIGEMCRYLLSVEKKTPEETQHNVRIMIGNGLRPEIFSEFRKRFRIENISEIFGSTDGNCNFGNFDNQPGAVGFIPLLFKCVYPMRLIKIDEVTNLPLRDSNGLAKMCKAGEDGELVGKIISNHFLRDFSGYANLEDESRKKIVRSVFHLGDVAFRTGDILVSDKLGYFYFKDRTGDTFRWKGENCSTTQIEGIMQSICNLQDVVVFGVKVPHVEVKAGMACIADPLKTLDILSLSENLKKELPPYALPVFIRICGEIEKTGTFKLKKKMLQSEGFDLGIVNDPIYMLTNGVYTKLTSETYQNVCDGQCRL